MVLFAMAARTLGGAVGTNLSTLFALDRDVMFPNDFDMASSGDGHYLLYRSRSPATSIQKLELAYCPTNCHLPASWVRRSLQTRDTSSPSYVAPSIGISSTLRIHATYRIEVGASANLILLHGGGLAPR